MTVVAILLAVLVLGLLLWDRSSRTTLDSPAARPEPIAQRRSAPAPPTAGSRAPRFRGVGAAPVAPPERRSPTAARGRIERPARPMSATAAASPRFAGEVRRSPNAIGLACGRPISQCTRGADCLCVD